MSRAPIKSLVAAFAFAVAAASCDGNPLLPGAVDLAAARAVWVRQHLTDYEYTLRRLCFCGETRPMRVTVRNGQVTSVVPEGEITPLPATEAQWYPSIDGLFDIIAAAIALPAASVRTEYDAVRGFPRSASIDYYARAVDDEISYVAGDFVAQ